MEILNPAALVVIEENIGIFLLLAAWSLVWKGLALWQAARLSHKWWFVIILIVNTVGILDILYIFLVARRYQVETKEIS